MLFEFDEWGERLARASASVGSGYSQGTAFASKIFFKTISSVY